MQFISSLLFGISASVDAFLVSVTFGLRGIHVKPRQNIFISIITLLGTCFSIFLGSQLTQFASTALWSILGSLVLLNFGLYYLIKCMPPWRKKCHTSSVSNSLSLKELFLLGGSLSANNMGIGLSASVTGLAMFPASFATFLFSYTFLWLGNHLGKCRHFSLSPLAADIITGLLLVLLGGVQLTNTLLNL